nr:hypothetical protein GCM10020063_103510 [Dactylosporangium thailandense]
MSRTAPGERLHAELAAWAWTAIGLCAATVTAVIPSSRVQDGSRAPIPTHARTTSPAAGIAKSHGSGQPQEMGDQRAQNGEDDRRQRQDHQHPLQAGQHR